MKKILLLLASAASILTATAEGYQVNNFSARQAGMANVGVAMKLGSESLYFNPAAAAHQQSKFDISLGATGVLSYVTASELPSMDNGYAPTLCEKSDNKMSTPLHVYFNYKPTDRLAVGVGFYTPDGSSVNWGDDWSGAHLVQKINLAAFTLQPTLSYRISDRISIGAGLMIAWGNFDLSRSLLPVGAGNTTLAGGFTLAANTLDALAANPLLPAEQAAQYQALSQQAGAGAQYFATNLRDRAIASAKLEGSANVAIGVNAGICGTSPTSGPSA